MNLRDIGKLLYKYFFPSMEKGSGFREVLLMVGFLIFYKFTRFLAIGDQAQAFYNAYQVIDIEKSLGIFYEIQFQQIFTDQVWLVKLLNELYMKLHMPLTIGFFFWLFNFKSKAVYQYVRNGFILANCMAIAVFILYPCAPPRMLHELGFVDTLFQISNINLYTGTLVKFFNQYAAMPSLHFGNSLLIAFGVCLYSSRVWAKMLAVIYPVMILVVIIATANHFFLDAVVGGLIVLIPYPLLSGVLYFVREIPYIRLLKLRLSLVRAKYIS